MSVRAGAALAAIAASALITVAPAAARSHRAARATHHRALRAPHSSRGATTAGGSTYQKVADPTGQLFGGNGGVVIGSSPGQALELGICNHGSAPLSQGYTYLWADPSGPGSSSKQGCNGDTPIAETDAVTGLSPTSATLNSSIDTNRLDTSAQFDYGTSTSYGIAPEAEDIGSSGEQHPSLTITGLTPGTTYHFRVTATNASGTSDGQDMTFTTPAG